MTVPRMLLPKQWIIPRAVSRAGILRQIGVFIGALDQADAWRVTVEAHRPERTSQQNRYLYGVAYKALSEATGYEIDEIAEYLCGIRWGWKDVRVPKTPRNAEGIESRPMRTTTTDTEGKRAVLNKQDFSDFVAFVQRFAAGKGVHIPDPDEQREDEEQAA